MFHIKVALVLNMVKTGRGFVLLRGVGQCLMDYAKECLEKWLLDSVLLTEGCF